MHFSKAVPPNKLSPTRRLQKGDVGTGCAVLPHGISGKHVCFLPDLPFLSPLALVSSSQSMFLGHG